MIDMQYGSMASVDTRHIDSCDVTLEQAKYFGGLCGQFAQQPLSEQSTSIARVEKASRAPNEDTIMEGIPPERRQEIVDAIRTWMPPSIMTIIDAARAAHALNNEQAINIRLWLRSAVGYGDAEVKNPIPVLDAIRFLLPIDLHAVLFDGEMREMIDAAATLAGVFEIPEEEDIDSVDVRGLEEDFAEDEVRDREVSLLLFLDQ